VQRNRTVFLLFIVLFDGLNARSTQPVKQGCRKSGADELSAYEGRNIDGTNP